MDKETRENIQMITGMIKDIGEKHIEPKRRNWDDEQVFPIDLFKVLGEYGLMGMLVPEKYGGAGLGYHEYATAIAELAKFDPAIGLSLAAHNSLCTNHILLFGTEDQKSRWLPRLSTAEWVGAWALTEPNTGSDAGNMLTTGVKEGDEWVLNGTKNFITHGNSSDIVVVIARTGKKGEKNSTTAFAIERDTPGLKKGNKEDKLGMRASETTEVVLDNCRISSENVLGLEGEGFKQAMKVLDGGRISIAALSLGIAEGALEASIQYSKERHQFGRPISDFQGISFKLADMATKVEAARQLINHAITTKKEGTRITKKSAMAKYYASEIGVEVATEAVQIFGGYGYSKLYPVEKYYRDSKLCTIGEGTSEIQKLVIAKDLLN